MFARNFIFGAILGLALSTQMAGATPPPPPTPAEVAQRDALVKRLAGNTLVVSRVSSNTEAQDFVPPQFYYLLPDGTARTRYGRSVRWEAGHDSLCVDEVGCWRVHVSDAEISLVDSTSGRRGQIEQGNRLGL